MMLELLNDYTKNNTPITKQMSRYNPVMNELIN